MTKLHSKGTVDGDPEAMHRQLQPVLDGYREPAVLEDGDDILVVGTGMLQLEVRSGRLWLDAWNESRSISRRLLAIESLKPGIAVCLVQRLAGLTGKLTILDNARPKTAILTATSTRKSFAERFRLMLSRSFPGWSIEQLTAAKDLRRSFSSVYPRAHLRLGGRHQAALACAHPDDEPGLLTFALLWFDYLRQRLAAGESLSLTLFLPEHTGTLTAHRLHWLTGGDLNARVFLFNEHGSAGEVDLRDFGNVETRVRQPGDPATRTVQVEGPEYLLESAVRRQPEQIHPDLLPELVRTQVLTFASGERTIIDLLAVTGKGQLTILELKASEDLHLPLQALDYWIRIRWHAGRGELDRLFPGVALALDNPRLFLVAPATQFHSTNAIVLRYFSREVLVERIGVNSDSAQRLTVVMRLEGADAPISHQPGLPHI